MSRRRPGITVLLVGLLVGAGSGWAASSEPGPSGPGSGLPDLAVAEAFLPPAVEAGATVVLTLVIRNGGPENTAKPRSKSQATAMVHYRGAHHVLYFPLPDPGRNLSMQIPMVFTRAGYQRFDIILDPLDEIAELDEKNNMFTTQTMVNECGQEGSSDKGEDPSGSGGCGCGG